MIEININKNDADQRFDRFLRKYFENAPLSLLQKNIRKKNFKINGKKAAADSFVHENDKISMYIKDEDYNKWITKIDFKPSQFNLDVIYEDKNIIIMDKDKGVLTHSSSKADYGNNLVDNMLSYLYKTKQIDKSDRTFTPAVVNRLDRNTEGIVIGAKTAEALRSLNKAIRNYKINRYYLTIVKGNITKDFTIDTEIIKDESKNKIRSQKDGERIITNFKVLDTNKDFTLLECELITGKTHQIRYSLAKNKTPILGDKKYGDRSINKLMNDKFNINDQLLLAAQIKFNKIDELKYLNNRSFESKKAKEFLKLKDKIFNL